jgi:hypothetical protein
MVSPARRTRSARNTIIHVSDAPDDTRGPRRSLTNENEKQATFTAYQQANQDGKFLFCICQSARLHKLMIGNPPHVGSSMVEHSARIQNEFIKLYAVDGFPASEIAEKAASLFKTFTNHISLVRKAMKVAVRIKQSIMPLIWSII